ncbi:TIM23 complex component [Vermiconidia calcicola]|uniref:TIM23 complex component n=1 Tax=Vermiconidia calcicola TaxID=1690605 RepID=A0ACC3MS12_9PEZI|nr:TIM23 complex component [Vermiconidia calcicola]
MASLLCPRTSCARSSTTLHRAISVSKPIKSAFSSAARPLKQASLQPPRPSIVALIPPCNQFAPISLIRHASTAPSAPNGNSTSEDVLTWDRFFDLRRKRRYLNLASSVVTGGAAIFVFGPMIASQDIDGWAAQVSGLDPMVVLGVTTFAVATGGWLCGPSFGTALFKTWAGRRGWNQPIVEKEKSFYARVKRYRADPASSSIQNPIPDYYGEKIGSVKDYRRWLKDQRAFNLKKNKNMF